MEGNEAGDKVPIINEVLCFIQNEIGILEFDIIVQLCEENFDKATIEFLCICLKRLPCRL